MSRMQFLLSIVILSGCDGVDADVAASRPDARIPAVVRVIAADVQNASAPDRRPILPQDSRYDLPTCATLEQGSPDTVATLFEQHYPAPLVSPDTVDDIELSVADLDSLTAFAACAAAKNDYEPFVADNASALFASKRHGAAAFAALRRAAAGSGFAADAAQEFGDQMRRYVKPR